LASGAKSLTDRAASPVLSDLSRGSSSSRSRIRVTREAFKTLLNLLPKKADACIPQSATYNAAVAAALVFLREEAKVPPTREQRR
jgi:hypothetical protein